MTCGPVALLTIVLAVEPAVNSPGASPSPTEAAQAEKSVATCNRRLGSHLTLQDANGTRYTEEILADEVIHDDVLTLVPGEMFVVAGDERDGRLSSLRILQVSPPPMTALDVAFGQTPSNGKEPTMTVLRIQNPFAKRLKYKAQIIVAGTATPRRTTVCEVAPGKRTYEFWPDAIREIRLSEFQFLEWNDGDKLRCE